MMGQIRSREPMPNDETSMSLPLRSHDARVPCGTVAGAASLRARIACTEQDLQAAFDLRRAVFAGELGALADTDRCDAHACHLIVEDLSQPAGHRVVGTTRVMGRTEAAAAGGFYTGQEFDIAPLLTGGHILIEVGRTCLRREYRGGAAMVVLWRALAAAAAARGAQLLFGTASFPGSDSAVHRAALDVLHDRYPAPQPIRVRSHQGGWTPCASAGSIDMLAAMRATPAVLKSYLRLGGVIGDGVFVDRDFNTTDVCLMLDVRQLNRQVARLYGAA